MKILLSTRNQGKVREMQSLLEAMPVSLISLEEVQDAPYVEEDAQTLHGNARRKAVALQRHTGMITLADDTGLFVDALNGAPGVRSARWAGEDADDAANRKRLVEELAGRTDRAARFRTVVALADAGEVLFFEGVCEGRILEAERGGGGFGYDPLFAPLDESRSFAEMDGGEKNAISHRGRAMREVAAYLASRLGRRAEVGPR